MWQKNLLLLLIIQYEYMGVEKAQDDEKGLTMKLTMSEDFRTRKKSVHKANLDLYLPKTTLWNVLGKRLHMGP